jgi:hypothetical protein
MVKGYDLNDENGPIEVWYSNDGTVMRAPKTVDT